MFSRSPIFLAGIVLLSYVTGCNPTSKLGDNEYLLIKNKIINTKDKNSNDALTKIEQKGNDLINKVSGQVIFDYIQQKPNTKMLGLFQFHLAVYNYTNRKGRKKKLEKENNEDNIEEKIKKIVGEPPVILDSFLTEKSKKQMGLYLYNKGYFKVKIQDSVIYKKKENNKGGKAIVRYYISSGNRYAIKQIDYDIRDSGIKSILDQETDGPLLLSGMYYDEELLDNERKRLVRKLKNEGFFYFNKKHIRYIADTALGNNSIGLTIQIDRANSKTDTNSAKKAKHKKYTVNNIIINTDFNQNSEKVAKDTIAFSGYLFLRSKNIEIKKQDRDHHIKYKAITRKIFLKKGHLFRIEDLENSHKHLSGLQIFKYTNIQFLPNDHDNKLNCMIKLSPVPRQSFLIETEGTNSSGNLGIAENFIYRSKNLIKGAELFEFAINGGLEAQNTFGGTKSETIEPLDVFNTIEIGTSVKINFPKLMFPIKEEMIPKRYNPRTAVSAAYNYQQRTDYIRTIANLSFGYEWKEGKPKTHILYPIDLSSVKLDKNSLILDTINFISNDFIRNSFTDQLITAIRYSFIYSDQKLNKKANFNYFRGNLEIAGNMLRTASKLSNA
ncbi:MAG TPA: hypothetical protein EYN89_07030, partial [Flavobacteriales bacterium]|nr:hypothetical protein [Flavobacteriales bacterium]